MVWGCKIIDLTLHMIFEEIDVSTERGGFNDENIFFYFFFISKKFPEHFDFQKFRDIPKKGFGAVFL